LLHLLIFLILHVIISHYDTRLHLSCARRNKRVELIMQLVHLLMQVVVVLFGIGQLLLQLNLSSSQNVFFKPGFICLMEHMDQHALTVLVSCC
jgi:hypothetical protein